LRLIPSAASVSLPKKPRAGRLKNIQDSARTAAGARKNRQPINADNILRKKSSQQLPKLGLSTDFGLHSLRHFVATQADEYGMTEGALNGFLDTLAAT
jgi:hypothetical protein